MSALDRHTARQVLMLSTFAASPSYKATGAMKLATIAMKGIVADKDAASVGQSCVVKSR